jgi:hypothetical protein
MLTNPDLKFSIEIKVDAKLENIQQPVLGRLPDIGLSVVKQERRT